jgi:hypothetical protein
VAPLTNPTAAPLHGVRAYLEHLGGSVAGFTPTSWNIGTLAPGQVFYATWPLQAGGGKDRHVPGVHRRVLGQHGSDQAAGPDPRRRRGWTARSSA